MEDENAPVEQGEEQKKEDVKEEKKTVKKLKRAGLFFKVLTSVIVLHGMWCVTQSYALAWRDHVNVVETVSVTVVSQILAPLIVYGTTKTIENIFEKNKLAFSTPLEALSKDDEVKG